MSYIGTGVETVTFNTATTLDVAGNITLGGTVDGRDVATDGTKLDTITSGAIADILQDTTPQLGGNLDLNTSNVIGTGNINVTGSITGTSFVSTGNMSFTNNSKAIFGTSPSLEIYHDGSNSILDDVGAGNFKMQLAGADKLEITSTGVDVTGAISSNKGSAGTLATFTDGVNSNFVVETSSLLTTIGNGGGSTALAFKANNTEALRINSNGNVGIGTSNPGMLLDVDASGGSANDIARFSGRNSAGLTFRNATSQDFIIHTATSDALIFGTNGNNERIRITSSGNVGIGTSSPDTDTSKFGGSAKGLSVAAGQPVITIRATANSQYVGYFGQASTNTYLGAIGGGSLIIQTSTSGTERMRITAAGGIEIPNQNAINELTFTGTDFTNVLSASTNGFQLGTYGSGYLSLLTNNVERLNINGTTGNVGIGGTTASTAGFVRSLNLEGSDVALQLRQTTTNTSWEIGNDNTGLFRILNNGSNRLVITSSSNVLFGCSTFPSASVQGFAISGSSSGQASSSGSSTAAYNHLLFYNGNGLIGYIATSGSTTTYANISDYRLKTDVTYDWDATTRLKQLKPARFAWIADGDDAVPVDGFLAHEVQDIVPEAIVGTKDAVDEDGNPEYQGIDQSKLVPLLVKTIQELEARIAALENT